MSVVERALGKLRGGTPRGRDVPAQSGGTESIAALRDADAASADATRIYVDRAALRAAGYLPEENQDRRFADEYRQIKRLLLAHAFDADAAAGDPSPRLVMMASALPGDGKTFTSINLALSLARERDSSVVLVDADVAKPHISRIFGVHEQPGLLDAVAESGADVCSLILRTDVNGLSILPAGPVREGATELLSSARMASQAKRILARHPRSIVLFDSPPLAISSESRALVASMGHIVIVVRAGHTPRQAVLDALAVLGPDRAVSLVLNQGRRSLTEGYYGYSYGDYGSTAEK